MVTVNNYNRIYSILLTNEKLTGHHPKIVRKEFFFFWDELKKKRKRKKKESSIHGKQPRRISHSE